MGGIAERASIAAVSLVEVKVARDLPTSSGSSSLSVSVFCQARDYFSLSIKVLLEAPILSGTDLGPGVSSLSSQLHRPEHRRLPLNFSSTVFCCPHFDFP